MVKDFNQYNNIDEKVNWKNVRKYSEYTILALILGYSSIPKHIKNSMSKEVAKKYISYKMNNMEDIENKKYIEKSINHIIEKVKNSKHIENKEYVIDRIKNTKFKFLNKTKIFNNENAKMIYYYDINSDTDYIIVNEKLTDETNYIDLYHELNHLIDKYKEVKKEIDNRNILKNDISLNDYLNYFKDFPLIDKNKLKLNKDLLNRLPDRDMISFGHIYYNLLKMNENYYLSDGEIHSRLSNLKLTLMETDHLDNINDDIKKYHLENLKRKFMKYNNDPHEIFRTLLIFDFIIYLPIIDFNKLNDLNLIADLNKNNKFIS